jgi:hypothetical protein
MPPNMRMHLTEPGNGGTTLDGVRRDFLAAVTPARAARGSLALPESTGKNEVATS